MRKLIYILYLIIVCSFTTVSYAATKDKCTINANYDIYIDKQSVKTISKMKTLRITKEGQIILDAVPVPVSPLIKEQAIIFQNNIRQKLPYIEKAANYHLNDLKVHFAKTIEEKVGLNSSLLKHLNSIYDKLSALLKVAIKTANGELEFRHQAFNSLIDQGEKIVKKEFLGIIADSVKEFRLFKNYSTLKSITKKEWRQKKEDLKALNLEVCETIDEIEKQQTQLINAIKNTKWLTSTEG